MRKIILPFLFLLAGVNLFAQDYPLVTIQDIQFLPDSVINLGDAPSPLNGDTVRVRGVVLVSPTVNPETDRRTIMYAGGRWVTYIQDENGELWGGLNVLQDDTLAIHQGTFFDLIDTAQVVEFTGVVTEFSTSTEILHLVNPITPIQIISTLPKRPDPIQLSITDFMENGVLNFSAEKYEDMYVELHNVITSDRDLSNGNFRINDGQGNHMLMYNQSGYFTLRAYRLTGLTDYQPPQDGSILSYIRGIINSRTDEFYIYPMYPGDIGPIVTSPPLISDIRRDTALVYPNQDVEISAKVTDLDGTVAGAKIFYSVDGGPRDSVEMSFSASDTLYKGTIPGVSSDSALVDFYIWAIDNQDLQSVSPVDTTDDYFYLILNRLPTIKDVQYSPLGGGYSGYTNYEVTIRGIVTGDSSDVKGFGSSSFARNYIQDGEGPWSGIQISFGDPLGTDLYGEVLRGDDVTLTGTIQETFGVTRINNVTAYTINSHNNPLPAPQLLSTGEMGPFGDGVPAKEQWESVLVEFQNAEITNISADGASNFGEISLDDGSGPTRVELEDGNNSYHNGSGSPGTILVEVGATFDELIGIMYYSFSHFKLVPRKDDDFVNYTDVVDNNILPSSYNLDQNYPNPFNPSTTIQYSIPEAGNVNIAVFNILGQEVKTVLKNASQSAGTYRVVFDASNLPTGIYIYRIQVNDFVSTKKMILLK